MKCEINIEEIIDMKGFDDFTIPRLLVDKGFKHEGGPLQPRLIGEICRTFCPDTLSYKFDQIKP